MRISISTSIALVAVAVHAIVLPALYYGLDVVVTRSHTELFVQHVRSLSRNLAEELELGDALDSQRRVIDMLDLAVLNGDGLYAELVDNGVGIRSPLNAPGVHWPGRQSFGFGLGGAHGYFIALPVTRHGHDAELRLGFDERPTIEQIQLAMKHTLWVLTAYLVGALIVLMAWSYRFSRPVVQLQQTARKIGRGDYAQSLRLKTGIRELSDLGSDLENMRRELVGVNERLQSEMREKERAEERRQELEGRLRHRQRLETVGTLAGGIAHEFNNVLLPIVLFAESAIAESGENSAVQADLQEILAQAHRAKEVVEKVLTFSREAGAPALEAIDLEHVVREALKLFSALVPASVELRTELSGSLPPVRADAAMAVQMIMNLCTNAYQALTSGRGVVTVRLQHNPRASSVGEQASQGDWVVLSVEDTGQGIEPSIRDRIFEPFFTTRVVGGGTGLGLSVVHGIAETFGATISVESVVGRGSVFRISFPSLQPAEAADSSMHALSGVES